jgi:hypothetical protein
MPRSPADNRSSTARSTCKARCKPDESTSAPDKRSSSRISISPEPDLVMLLSNPEIQLLMHADKVEEAQLRDMLDSVAVQLRASRAAHDDDYRSGVAVSFKRRLYLNLLGEFPTIFRD